MFVVSRARRFVWAQDKSQMRFIKNHMSKNMEPTPLFPGITDKYSGRFVASITSRE
jgi:hypothetical protein